MRWQAKIEKTLTHIYQSIDLFSPPSLPHQYRKVLTSADTQSSPFGPITTDPPSLNSVADGYSFIYFLLPLVAW